MASLDCATKENRPLTSLHRAHTTICKNGKSNSKKNGVVNIWPSKSYEMTECEEQVRAGMEIGRSITRNSPGLKKRRDRSPSNDSVRTVALDIRGDEEPCREVDFFNALRSIPLRDSITLQDSFVSSVQECEELSERKQVPRETLLFKAKSASPFDEESEEHEESNEEENSPTISAELFSGADADGYTWAKLFEMPYDIRMKRIRSNGFPMIPPHLRGTVWMRLIPPTILKIAQERYDLAMPFIKSSGFQKNRLHLDRILKEYYGDGLSQRWNSDERYKLVCLLGLLGHKNPELDISYPLVELVQCLYTLLKDERKTFVFAYFYVDQICYPSKSRRNCSYQLSSYTCHLMQIFCPKLFEQFISLLEEPVDGSASDGMEHNPRRKEKKKMESEDTLQPEKEYSQQEIDKREEKWKFFLGGFQPIWQYLFESCFTTVFPLMHVGAIFDFLLVYGCSFLLKFSLFIMIENENVLIESLNSIGHIPKQTQKKLFLQLFSGMFDSLRETTIKKIGLFLKVIPFNPYLLLPNLSTFREHISTLMATCLDHSCQISQLIDNFEGETLNFTTLQLVLDGLEDCLEQCKGLDSPLPDDEENRSKEKCTFHQFEFFATQNLYWSELSIYNFWHTFFLESTYVTPFQLKVALVLICEESTNEKFDFLKDIVEDESVDDVSEQEALMALFAIHNVVNAESNMEHIHAYDCTSKECSPIDRFRQALEKSSFGIKLSVVFGQMGLWKNNHKENPEEGRGFVMTSKSHYETTTLKMGIDDAAFDVTLKIGQTPMTKLSDRVHQAVQKYFNSLMMTHGAITDYLISLHPQLDELTSTKFQRDCLLKQVAQFEKEKEKVTELEMEILHLKDKNEVLEIQTKTQRDILKDMTNQNKQLMERIEKLRTRTPGDLDEMMSLSDQIKKLKAENAGIKTERAYLSEKNADLMCQQTKDQRMILQLRTEKNFLKDKIAEFEDQIGEEETKLQNTHEKMQELFTLIESLDKENLKLFNEHKDMKQRIRGIDAKIESISEEYSCPITHSIMADPVMTMDGHTYERRFIEDWLSKKGDSPMTGLELENKMLMPNIRLKKISNEIEEFRQMITSYC
eukprot:CAMPEP_0115028864 /NCGR_PEP_ID=MMETSP0216-20121206/36609_1 /TAXON_ID=223996 /ORGANISM="Protocruzia adherens, Strain Boccale" /LENGTH=1088 /DNA_ID=CAMNT_0002405239 /DNA_START=35 /DNA_END=3301 /DNA_ORIENTATION=+